MFFIFFLRQTLCIFLIHVTLYPLKHIIAVFKAKNLISFSRMSCNGLVLQKKIPVMTFYPIHVYVFCSSSVRLFDFFFWVLISSKDSRVVDCYCFMLKWTIDSMRCFTDIKIYKYNLSSPLVLLNYDSLYCFIRNRNQNRRLLYPLWMVSV